MKINQIIVETTTSGAVASVAQPLGGVQKRSGNKKAGSMFKGKTTNKPFYEAEINEEDRIIAPGKGHKVKPGLLAKPEVSMNPTDSIKLDVPLLIRLLEYAREDAGSDLDLHDLAEKLVQRGTRGKTLTMKDYEFVVDECMTPGGVIAGGGVGEDVSEGAAPWASNWKKAALASKKAQQSPSGANHKRAAELHRAGAKDPWGPYKDKHIEAAEKHEKAMKMYEGEKVDRMVKHIAKSERGLGHSKKEAENIAWATANKRGYLDNKNKKK